MTPCLNLFQAKPVTFQLNSAHVTFTASYLQGIAFNHYTTLLRFEYQNPILSNWQIFVNKFSSKFGVFDTVAEAEDNLFNFRMRSEERFTTFIIHFKKEARTSSGWRLSNLHTMVIRLWSRRLTNTIGKTTVNTTIPESSGTPEGRLGRQEPLIAPTTLAL
ncbi:hypothetical protein C0992_008223 [Termitomyces sp. T32_za158]|nr:hypothetical protein C0992_008223 [Termitomyces sp. T32_za158]